MWPAQVVTWLIRTVLETREETALLLRTFAQCEFARGEGLNLGTPRADDPLLNQLTVRSACALFV